MFGGVQQEQGSDEPCFVRSGHGAHRENQQDPFATSWKRAFGRSRRFRKAELVQAVDFHYWPRFGDNCRHRKLQFGRFEKQFVRNLQENRQARGELEGVYVDRHSDQGGEVFDPDQRYVVVRVDLGFVPQGRLREYDSKFEE